MLAVPFVVFPRITEFQCFGCSTFRCPLPIALWIWKTTRVNLVDVVVSFLCIEVVSAFLTKECKPRLNAHSLLLHGLPSFGVSKISNGLIESTLNSDISKVTRFRYQTATVREIFTSQIRGQLHPDDKCQLLSKFLLRFLVIYVANQVLVPPDAMSILILPNSSGVKQTCFEI